MEDIGVGFFEEARENILAAWGNPDEKKMVTTPLTIIVGKTWP